MKKLLFFTLILGVLLPACGPSASDVRATVAAQVDATVAAQPPQEVQVQVPATVIVEVPVQVPATVIVEVTSVVVATQAAQSTPETAATAAPLSPAATAAPAQPASGTPQDPLAGANLTPVIAEDFIVPDYWYEFDTSSGSGEINGTTGNYQMISKSVENMEWSFNGRKSGNFYLTATTIVPDTKCKAGDHWGVMFRHKDNANFYVFGVSCDGKYRLMKRVDGLFENIVDFTDSSAIRKLGQRNVLGVRAVGGQISLYANDQFLTTVNDGSFAEGVTGMYVFSRLTPNLTVIFDDITVYAVSQ